MQNHDAAAGSFGLRYRKGRGDFKIVMRELFIFAFVGAFVCGCTKSTDEQMSDKAAKALVDAQASAETAIRQMLPMPGSAQFRDERTFTVADHPGTIVCGDFAGKNKSGTMMDYSDFVWGTPDSISAGLSTLSISGEDKFSQLQLKACTDTPGNADEAESQVQNQA